MSTIYIQLKKNLRLSKNRPVQLRHVAKVHAEDSLQKSIERITLYWKDSWQQQELIIDGLFIIRRIKKHFPQVMICLIGDTFTIASIKQPSRKRVKIFVPFIWLLLFIGAAMTIMNFHHDVGMQEVQQKLHYMFTGKNNDYPLWIQIPYSIGLGIGMILFFNYWFKRKINEEPSPLEVELYKYEQEIEQYKYYEMIKDDEKRH